MTPGAPSSHEPQRRSNALDIALVVWPSFLAACVASLLFFAVVDPELLRDAGPRLLAGIDREAGYALGFFFFWGIGALASTLSVYLIRTDRPARRGRGTS
ncbi:MAG TPA: hypothetical protein VLV25_10905 [Steroidobacteraceae bacterium]|nr:hypothetical protein [Steroidobacteraceae bacterium]